MALPVRKGYNGAPANAVLTNNPGSNVSTDTTFIVDTTTNWGVVPFFCVVEAGTSREEKVKVTAKSGTTLTVVRASDNTTVSAHSAGASIYPVFTASEADEANQIASVMTTKGDLISNDGSTINRVGVGANSLVLQADSALANGVKWDQVATAGIANSAVTLEKLASAVQNLLIPTGTINAYAHSVAPTGWLMCDGTSTAGYTLLASYVGATTPDLRGKFLMGKTATGIGSTLLGSGGSTTITEANLPVHQHTMNHTHGSFTSSGQSQSHNHTVSLNDPGHFHNVNGNVANLTVGGGVVMTVLSYLGGDSTNGLTNLKYTGTTVSSVGNASQDHTHSVTVTAHTGNTGTVGSGTAYFQPFVAVNYIIKHD